MSDQGSSRSESPGLAPPIEAIARLTRARHALDEIISDPHMPDDLVLQANATANKISDYEIRWQLDASVKAALIAEHDRRNAVAEAPHA